MTKKPVQTVWAFFVIESSYIVVEFKTKTMLEEQESQAEDEESKATTDESNDDQAETQEPEVEEVDGEESPESEEEAEESELPVVKASDNTVAQLNEICIERNLPKKAWAKLKKDALVDYINSQTGASAEVPADARGESVEGRGDMIVSVTNQLNDIVAELREFGEKAKSAGAPSARYFRLAKRLDRFNRYSVK